MTEWLNRRLAILCLSLAVLVAVHMCSKTPAQAALQDCTLTWAPNTEADLAGYRVYVAPTPGGYNGKGPALDVGKNQTSVKCAALRLPAPATYYFVVTAYDTSGNESTFSKEVNKALIDVPVKIPAIVKTVKPDTTGADVTIDGPAVKLYVATDLLTLTALDNYVAGTSTYRYAKVWTKETFVCFTAEDADGVRTEQGCNVPVIGPPVDTQPPSAPTILEITMQTIDGKVLLSFNKGDLCK